MGAAYSVMRQATKMKGSSKELHVMTREEVEEDEACMEAQRQSIKYCVDNLYYSAPVTIGAVRTPTHHLPTALISFDTSRSSMGAEFLASGDAKLSFFPESCVVSPTGDIIVTRITPVHKDASSSSPADAEVAVETKHVIRAATLQSVVHSQRRHLPSSVFRGESRDFASCVVLGPVPNGPCARWVRPCRRR